MSKLNIRETVIALLLSIVSLVIVSILFKPVDRDPYRGLTHSEIESGIREQLQFGVNDTLTLTAEEGDYSRWHGQLDGDGGGYIIVLSTKGGVEIVVTGQGELACEEAAELGIPPSLMETCDTEDSAKLEQGSIPQ